MTSPRFLQRLHFSPGGRYEAMLGPSIVQYHPQATSEFAKRQGTIVARVEPFAEEHGPSLAAGPEALDLLSRILAARDAMRSEAVLANLLHEARVLVQRAAPPAGSVHPNGTPCTREERETAACAEDAARAVHEHACPTCHVPAGHACHTKGGPVRAPHGARFDLVRQSKKEV